jgi:hypothetical protein
MKRPWLNDRALDNDLIATPELRDPALRAKLDTICRRLHANDEERTA